MTQKGAEKTQRLTEKAERPTEYHVFFSHHPRDAVAAEELAERLKDEQGMQVWLRAWDVRAGEETQEQREQGLARSNACAVLIGPEGVQSWQRLELRAAIARRGEEEGSSFPVIPVLLPGCPAEVEAALPSFLRVHEPVRFTGLDSEDAFHRLACSIQGQPPGPGEPDDLPCPFPGLDPFREGMAAYFCGRTEEIDQLEALLDVSPLAVVKGPSGCGKSSLVLAGLIPRLRDTQAGPSPWIVHTLRPGREPLQSLALTLVPQIGDPRRDHLVTALAADTRELSRAVQAELAQAPDHMRRVLFVVDQFEEVFTLCQDRAERDAFIGNLLDACPDAAAPARVILTLRAGFGAACYDYERLVNPACLLPVLTLRGERLRRAIEDAARAAGLLLQRGLVDTLLDDVAGEKGALPLVAYTLLQLFERRNGRWLTLEAYHDLGNVKGIIAARAEAALARLRTDLGFPQEQVEDLMRRILLRLVQVSENSPTTRQQVAQREFFWAQDGEAQRALLGTGLELLIEQRLLTKDSDDRGEIYINLAHEVIIEAWKRLADWVDEGMEDLLTRRRVEEAARQWERSGRDQSLLYRGLQLENALKWQQRRI
ncbi:MAG: toll/interleukin-1 receptor domain-containing protein [Anaerolineae bacterium]